MEVFALNEQLREEFAGVVKHFLTIRREEIARVAAITASVNNAATAEPPPGDPSLPVTSPTASPKSSQLEHTSTPSDVFPPVSAPTKPQLSPGSVLPERTQQYATLAKAILAKVNMYQYSSREQFARDIAALLELADSNDQKLLLQQLVDQQRALAGDTKASGRPKKRIKVNGIRIDSAAIPGIQQLPTGKWACNLDMHGNTSITSKWNSYERALEMGYKVEIRDEFRRMQHGEQVLKGMSRELAASCAKFDREIWQDAVNQVKQRLPIAKHHDVSSLTAALAPQPATPVPTTPSQPSPTPPPAIAKEKEANPTRKRELVIDTTVPKTTPTGSTPGKPITPAAAAPDLVAKRTPTDKSSRVRFLRLRRIIQIRLCRHLEGREICARLNEPGHDEGWVATGRLEKGKVYAYNTKKYASFSDFVQATLKRSVAACEHIYLLDTRENIDAHLLVCDQFSDEFRQRLDDENFKEVSELYKQGKHS